MTDQDRAEFDRQAAQWAARAKRERGTVTHVTWRDGHMEATITPGKPQPQEPQWVPRSSRGITQGALL